MSFKSLIEFFRQDDWTENLVQKFDEMLDLGGAMFAYTMGVLMDGSADPDPSSQIFARDRQINKLVRLVRRRIISHLTLASHRTDVPTALIFMNAIKDAERIGDYVKNIYEIVDLMPAQPDRALYRQHLSGHTRVITDLVVQTRKAFASSDGEEAGSVIHLARRLGRQCEDDIRGITLSDLGTQDAVCLVLALRFFKRISSHLSNIATTVVMPVDLLDFHDEPRD